MLVALLTIVFLGGGAGMDLFPKSVQKNVAAVVEDESTAEAVVAQMQYVNRVGAELSKTAAKSFRTWRKRDLDHDAGPELFQEAIDEADGERMRTTNRVLDGLFAMKDQMSRSEWEALFATSE